MNRLEPRGWSEDGCILEEEKNGDAPGARKLKYGDLEKKKPAEHLDFEQKKRPAEYGDFEPKFPKSQT